jgi:uncharacterized protein YecE (DUF72 family)
VASQQRLYVGTAGWSIPRVSDERCPGEGSHLQRYARVFPCTEINSSFHRPHAPATYARWAASTPASFRFAVKIPKEITHVQKLKGSRRALEQFLAESSALGDKRGPLLVQLPPSLEFDTRQAGRFFALLRSLHTGPVVCEPRHASWFAEGDALLMRYDVARVAADPSPVPGADIPGGWGGLVYVRLHGSPRKYWSSYDDDRIEAIARVMRESGAETWCIFDNTASGAALGNAWQLLETLTYPVTPP